MLEEDIRGRGLIKGNHPDETLELMALGAGARAREKMTQELGAGHHDGVEPKAKAASDFPWVRFRCRISLGGNEGHGGTGHETTDEWPNHNQHA